MKVFFALLLLTNIIFALLQWMLPYEQLIRPVELSVAGQKLKLLDETEELDVAQSQQSDVAGDVDTENMASASGGPDKLCYTLGPFKDQQASKEVSLKFRQNRIAISSRSSLEKEYMGMMVFLEGFGTREEAVNAANSLGSKGVRDYIIVNEPDRLNFLSLGVFSRKKNADSRIKRIRRLGYDVKSEARYRNRTIYWLDYSESESENLTRFIDTLKVDKGISRISRKCS